VGKRGGERERRNMREEEGKEWKEWKERRRVKIGGESAWDIQIEGERGVTVVHHYDCRESYVLCGHTHMSGFSAITNQERKGS